jgi:flagellar basal-body rod protein FlgB
MGLFADRTQIALEHALSGASLRQQLLANNLANANTPGYKRSDVDFHDALAAAIDGDTAETPLEDVAFQPVTDQSTGRLDGNNVDVDVETASLSENAVEYQALVAVAHARLQMIQKVIEGR